MNNYLGDTFKRNEEEEGTNKSPTNNEMIMDKLNGILGLQKSLLEEYKKSNDINFALLEEKCGRGNFRRGELIIREGYCPKMDSYSTFIKDQVETIQGSKLKGTIPPRTFEEAQQLQIIEMKGDESGFSIGEEAFYGCKSLVRVFLNNCTSIGDRAFACSRVCHIAWNSKCKSIGKYAFGGCNSLSCFNLGDSVEKLGERVFNNCESLEKIILSNNINKIEGEEDQKEGYYPKILGELPNIKTIEGPKKYQRLEKAYPGITYKVFD